MKKILPTLILLMATCVTSVQAEGLYGSIKIQNAVQNLSGLPHSPWDGRVTGPDSERAITGSLALGYAFSGGWRLEGEYTTGNDSEFKSWWSQIGANVNTLQTSSQRFMINGYKDFAINDWLSLYGMAGVGVANIDAEGYQLMASRRFANNNQKNIAYSMGVGADAKLNERITLGTGYRFVNLGNIETGKNNFTHTISGHDERLKGTLKEHNVFVEARMSF
jgi:opacity protein-like surface antigen